MKKMYAVKGKALILMMMIFSYLLIGVVFAVLVSQKVIQQTPSPNAVDNTLNQTLQQESLQRLQLAEHFFTQHFVMPDGHINLYLAVDDTVITVDDANTNSEAASYYLLWTAIQENKSAFDKELTFMRAHMVQPNFGYLMWRLNENNKVVDDGSNIASDADIRVIKALLIAQQNWPDDPLYPAMINQLATGLEKVAITKDTHLAPYGGVSGETATWTSDEVWLSYVDFTVIKSLSRIRGEPWTTMYATKKEAVLNAQLANGLYNSMLTQDREYGNGIDGSGYSINSMWIMVRNAESDDVELQASARKSLSFYKDKYFIDGELYQKYGSDGNALLRSESPWVYALVGRAAVALGDVPFSEEMITQLLRMQVNDPDSPLHGAIIEGSGDHTKIGQFTMQESILTLQAYARQ